MTFPFKERVPAPTFLLKMSFNNVFNSTMFPLPTRTSMPTPYISKEGVEVYGSLEQVSAYTQMSAAMEGKDASGNHEVKVDRNYHLWKDPELGPGPVKLLPLPDDQKPLPPLPVITVPAIPGTVVVNPLMAPGASASGGENKVFKIENQKWGLTYSTHIPKTELIDFLTSVIGEMKFVRCAHETADEKNPYEHTHVVIDVGKKFKRSGKNVARLFDFGRIHPHFEPYDTQLHFKNARKYLSKEDPENADLKVMVDVSAAELCLSFPILSEYLMTCKDPGKAMGMIALWTALHARPKVSEDVETFNGWQKGLRFETESKGNQRKITWVYDPIGGKGKTYYCKALVALNPKKYLSLGSCHSSRDAATIIQGAMNCGWTGDTILVNFSRQASDHKIYEWLENIRDGFMTVTKYAGEVLLFNNLHMQVFANWIPNINALSEDRWDIRLLSVPDTIGAVCVCVPLNIREARKMRENDYTLMKLDEQLQLARITGP